MKIRNGFVSNSSSSSFIILLPESFDISTIDFQAKIDKCRYADEATIENVKKVVEKLLKEHQIYDEECYREIDVVHEIFKDYILESIDTGPDEGSMTLVDVKKVKKILGI